MVQQPRKVEIGSREIIMAEKPSEVPQHLATAALFLTGAGGFFDGAGTIAERTTGEYSGALLGAFAGLLIMRLTGLGARLLVLVPLLAALGHFALSPSVAALGVSVREENALRERKIAKTIAEGVKGPALDVPEIRGTVCFITKGEPFLWGEWERFGAASGKRDRVTNDPRRARTVILMDFAKGEHLIVDMTEGERVVVRTSEIPSGQERPKGVMTGVFHAWTDDEVKGQLALIEWKR